MRKGTPVQRLGNTPVALHFGPTTTVCLSEMRSLLPLAAALVLVGCGASRPATEADAPRDPSRLGTRSDRLSRL